MPKIYLTAVESELADAWEQHCGDLPGVTVHRGSIFDLEDRGAAMVSPANSFGFMDGGIDQLYLDRYGVDLESVVRQWIAEMHGGELPVGNATMLTVRRKPSLSLIVAPTMRVPMVLPEDTVNPYLAARAVMNLVRDLSPLAFPVAFPGLGTGVGGVPPRRCAKQFRAAYQSVFQPQAPQSWQEAQRWHQQLTSDY